MGILAEWQQHCFYKGYYHNNGSPGPENAHIYTKTPALCQEMCQRNSKCFLFSWRKRDNACHLKAANAGNGRLTPDESGGHISGPKECVDGCLYSGYYHNNGSPGPHNWVFRTDNARGCQAKCQENERCFLFSWRERDNACHLKAANAG